MPPLSPFQRPLISRNGGDALIKDETPDTPERFLFRIARDVATNPQLSPTRRRQIIWNALRDSPPSMPPQRFARLEADPNRRQVALDGLMLLATSPDRADQDPQDLVHLWANGLQADPGAFERQYPPLPDLTIGQRIGYLTDPYADQRLHPVRDGFKASLYDRKADCDKLAALGLRLLGDQDGSSALLQDALRSRQSADALLEPYRFDPNAGLGFKLSRMGGGLVGATGKAKAIYKSASQANKALKKIFPNTPL